MLNAFLLLLLLAGLARFMQRDLESYRQFVCMTETVDRAATFKRWLIRSFVTFTVASLAALALLGRVETIVAMPPEFGPAAASLREASGPKVGTSALAPFLAGAFVAMIAGLLVSIVLPGILRGREAPRKDQPHDALLPRNAIESRWVIATSVNAAIGEELFFRLVMPLLLLPLTGRADVAFGVALILFGAVHLYQGWQGVASATVIGALLTAAYLVTGQLWVAIALHLIMNLNFLFLRPALMKRQAPAPR